MLRNSQHVLFVSVIRLDPQDRGSLPLEKIKAGLQGLGLSVGKIARGTWLQLADR